MDLYRFFLWLNNDILALPTTVLFLGAAVFFTFKLRFIQFRAFGRFIQMIVLGMKRRKEHDLEGNEETISGFHALFTAMATSIGTGSIVAPSLAIIAGGPGALFWLIVYLFFGSVTKFIEATFAMHTREFTGEQKKLVGGPMQYLKVIHPYLASWYGSIMLLLYFFGWQTVQSNTLANMYAQESVPQWLVGLILAILVYTVLRGGAQRIGNLASALVPCMFFLYVGFALYIITKDMHALAHAFTLIGDAVWSARAVSTGFGSGVLFTALRVGVYRGIFISEAGLGTSSIAHAMADTKNDRDQGILAMYSTIADIILSLISGLLVLVSNVWVVTNFRATLIYEVFKMHSPVAGEFILLVSISLFVFTTLMGNGFNGMQIFGTFTQFRWIHAYTIAVAGVVFLGAIMPVPLVWEIMDTLLAMAAIPNLIGLLILTVTKSELLQYKGK